MSGEWTNGRVHDGAIRRIMRSMTAETSATAVPPISDKIREDADLCALMARVARQDENALAELYDLTSARVFAVARRITRQTTAAEEVVSDVYFQVWQLSERYDAERGRVITWLLTLCRSRALDWLRRKDDALVHEDPASLQPESTNFNDEPFDLLNAFQVGADVHAAIATLDERARYLIGLAFFRGLTHQEIADFTKIPLGTIKTQIRTALSVLREHLHHHHCRDEIYE